MALTIASQRGSVSAWYYRVLTILFSLTLVAFCAYCFLLIVLSVRRQMAILELTWLETVTAFVDWFDPVFFQYNMLLLLVAVLIAPAITVFYLINMRGVKERRLQADIPQSIWAQEEKKRDIRATLERAFELRNYIGSMIILTAITAMGAGIILLLKPLPLSGIGDGVDYAEGVNFLMLGPYMELFMEGKTAAYISKLMVTLTAFQFGFLGAYIYFIGHLVRSYFTLDLSPHTFVASCIRMVRGAVMALVLSFGLQQLEFFKAGVGRDAFLGWLPLVSFFFGFYPSRAVLIMENWAVKIVNSKQRRYFSTPLTRLPGMSYSYQTRLDREGYDNVESLLRMDTIDMAIRTGFSYQQLERWKSQARLLAHMGEDYHAFWRATGMTSMTELEDYLARPGACADVLIDAVDAQLQSKVRVVCAITGPNPSTAVTGHP